MRFHITKGLQKLCKKTDVTLQVPQCSFISGAVTFISLIAFRKARIPVRTPLIPTGISPSAFSTY
ncbi:hypothetical protein BS47DRAFT_1354398, partial [Hydnum rufescens UP504]